MAERWNQKEKRQKYHHRFDWLKRSSKPPHSPIGQQQAPTQAEAQASKKKKTAHESAPIIQILNSVEEETNADGNQLNCVGTPNPPLPNTSY